MKSLREDVCQLFRGVDSDQTKMTLLDRLVGEVLADVNVLRTLTAADDVVAPFDARAVVFVDSDWTSFCRWAILRQRASGLGRLPSLNRLRAGQRACLAIDHITGSDSTRPRWILTLPDWDGAHDFRVYASGPAIRTTRPAPYLSA